MPDSTMLQSKDLQERYERYKAKIKNFTIMNDIFMRNVLKKKECTEYILQVIMEDKGITVIDQTLQKDYKNLQGHSAILDSLMWRFRVIMKGLPLRGLDTTAVY